MNQIYSWFFSHLQCISRNKHEKHEIPWVIIVANFLQYLCAKNYENSAVDKGITKRGALFMVHSVLLYYLLFVDVNHSTAPNSMS